MNFVAASNRKMWFGTEERMGWIPTPNTGANVSPEGWSAGGTLLNGGAFQHNSFNAAKNYIFDWPQSSSREMAQKMQSYANGSFGRGLLYFLDPLTYTTNVFPAMWADPSIGVGDQGSTLRSGVTPVDAPGSGRADLPVRGAYYDMSSVPVGNPGKKESLFIPIPEGYTLSLGAFYNYTGSARVFYVTQAANGSMGSPVAITPLTSVSTDVLNTFIPGGANVGVRIYLGRTAAAAASLTLYGMTARLIPSVQTTSEKKFTNYFTNPHLEGSGTQVEVYRNYFPNPTGKGMKSGTVEVFRTNLSPGLTAMNYTNVTMNAGVLFSNQGQALRFTTVASGTATRIGQVLGNMKQGTDYTVTFKARASEDVTNVTTQLRPNVGANPGTIIGPIISIPSGISDVSFTIRSRTDVTYGVDSGWAMTFTSGTVASTLEITDLIVTESSTRVPFFNGAYLPPEYEGMTVAWTGPVNNSPSTVSGVLEKVWTNHFTNPNLVGSGTWADYRRNLATQPRGVGTSWGANGGTITTGADISAAPIEGVTTCTRVVATASVEQTIASSAVGQNLVTPGTVITLSVYTRLSRSRLASLRYAFIDAANEVIGTIVIGAATTVPMGEPHRLVMSGVTVPAGAVRVSIGAMSSAPNVQTGDVFEVTAAMVEVSPVARPYFDAVLPDFSVDPDMRTVLDGAVPVMQGQSVRGLTAVSCLAIVSTRDGKPALRLIPTSDTARETYAQYSIPSGARSQGTVLGTRHSDTAIPGSNGVRGLWAGTPSQWVQPQVGPTPAGTSQLRLHYEGLTANSHARWYVGTVDKTAGDVWWTDIGLYDSSYPGDYFGGTRSEDADPDLVVSFDGAVDNSTSSIKGVSVYGPNGVNCRLVRSWDWATPGNYSSIRLIPITAGAINSAFEMATPSVLRSTGFTVSAVSRLKAPLTGTVSQARGGIRAYNPAVGSTNLPNEAGVYEVSVTSPAQTSNYAIGFWNGASAGNGSVWFSDIIITAPGYKGPFFDGDHPLVDPDLQTLWVLGDNTSETAVFGVPVRGVVGLDVAAVASTWGGKPAIRLIPTTPSNNSYAQFGPSYPPGTTRTLVGTVHNSAPLTGDLLYPRTLRVSGQAGSETPDAAVGSFPVRLTHTWNPSASFATVRNGAAISGGDVWWTDVALVDGEFDGPFFDGDSQNAIGAGRNLRAQWDGTPGNSTSSLWTRTLEFDKLKSDEWIGGQGHSGCRFVGRPTYINHSGVTGGQVEFAATLKEVGSWVYG